MRYEDNKYPGSGDFVLTRPKLSPTQVDKVALALSSNLVLEASLPALVATTNDLPLPRGQSFRLSTSGGAQTVTGFANGMAGRFVFILNVGANNISLANQNVGSKAENQIITGTSATVAIQPNRSALLIYDGVSFSWRLVAFT